MIYEEVFQFKDVKIFVSLDVDPRKSSVVIVSPREQDGVNKQQVKSFCLPVESKPGHVVTTDFHFRFLQDQILEMTMTNQGFRLLYLKNIPRISSGNAVDSE